MEINNDKIVSDSDDNLMDILTFIKKKVYLYNDLHFYIIYINNNPFLQLRFNLDSDFSYNRDKNKIRNYHLLLKEIVEKYDDYIHKFKQQNSKKN